jgi:release factor glutamine methyltransferase
MTLSVMLQLARCTRGFLVPATTRRSAGAAWFYPSTARISKAKVVQRLFASYTNDKHEETKPTLDNNDNGDKSQPQSIGEDPDLNFEPTDTDTNGIDWKSATVSGVLSESIELLGKHNISEPTESAVNLLAASLAMPWETGHRDLRQIAYSSVGERQRERPSERRLTVTERHDYASKIQRRLQHEPIQYILGQWDFLDYTLQIQRPLLCPRPETEELVGLVLQDMKKTIETATSESTTRVLDIGCGTGCIGIALAAGYENCQVTAIDVEPVAVKVAAVNAASILGPSWRNRYSVVLESAEDYNRVTTDIVHDDNRFHVVVSNPPYIPSTDKASLAADVINYESVTALISGHDGLDVIRTIVRKLPEWCVAGAICWMEVDPTHPNMLRQWLASSGEGAPLGVEYVEDFQDLYGRDRFVKLRVVETR